MGGGHNYSHYSPEEIWHAAHHRHAVHHRRERDALRTGLVTDDGSSAVAVPAGTKLKTFDDHEEDHGGGGHAGGAAAAADASLATSAAADAAIAATAGAALEQQQQLELEQAKVKVQEQQLQMALQKPLQKPLRKPIEPGEYPEAKELATLMRDLDLPRGDVVCITFSNSKMAALTVGLGWHALPGVRRVTWTTMRGVVPSTLADCKITR